MNSSTLRRLASDQVSLRRETPPNYLFPPSADSSTLPDDLTQLTILVTGAQGTVYSQGLWRLHLSLPDDYPKSPPKATFKTRIYHPNVEELTGVVCLDTLKKDWHSKLTLRDILVTISCLLIHPNPDSALNSAAGALLQEDYDAFAKQARLMTSIHAPIPPNLRDAVIEAKRRGEEDSTRPLPSASQASSSATSTVMRRQSMSNTKDARRESDTRPPSSAHSVRDLSEDCEEGDETKENDPSHSPAPRSGSIEWLRKNALGKRPLSELPTTVDPHATHLDSPLDDCISPYSDGKTSVSRLPLADSGESPEHVKKSPKLDLSARNLNNYGKVGQEDRDKFARDEGSVICPTPDLSEDKENMENVQRQASCNTAKVTTEQLAFQDSGQLLRPTLRKVSNVGSARVKGQPRVGIRRL